jgi:hypothetical protein
MLLNSMFTLIKEMVSPVMTSTITEIASNLNETFTNRYELVLTIAELAKKLLDEARTEQEAAAFYNPNTVSSSEKVIYQALVMKASEIGLDDNQLIG